MLASLLLIAAVVLPAGVMGTAHLLEQRHPVRQSRRTVRTRTGALVTIR